jgi:hypothetical protein
MAYSYLNSILGPSVLESQLEIYELNSNGLRGKVSELKNHINSRKPDIVCLCETWLKKNEPKFLGYQRSWLHRPGEKGGLGILKGEDVRFQHKQVVPFPSGFLECQSVKIFTKSDSIIILNRYNPCKNISLEELQHYTNKLWKSYILIDDFNGHSPVWDSCNRINPTGRNIERLLEIHNLVFLSDKDSAIMAIK